MSEPQAAVIGYGYAGRSFHSYLISITDGLTLRGVASRSADTREKIREERGCRAYESFDQAITDPEVGLVVLGTPNHVHAEQAIRAMDAGKHVVTDKPMCRTLAECDRMIEASRRNDVLLTVFQNRRWDGDYLTLRKLRRTGELGNLRWLEMAWNCAGPSSNPWRRQADLGGGRLFDLGAHMIDQVMMLFPQAVETVYCRLQRDFEDTDVESHAMVVIGFEGGNTAVVDAGSMHAIEKPRIHAFGSKAAYIKYGRDPQEGAMNRGDIDAAEEPEELYGRLKTREGEERRVPTVDGRWRCFYENIAAVLAGQAEPAVNIPEMRRVMAIFDAAFESGETDRVIRPDIPALPEA